MLYCQVLLYEHYLLFINKKINYEHKSYQCWFTKQKLKTDFLRKQVRLAMVPRDSQQRPQLYEQHEILMNDY